MKEQLLVLGGGIIGLSCAYEAAKGGERDVTVLEMASLGGQASGAAAGMLAPYSENTEQRDVFFELCQDSLNRYPSWVQEIEQLSGINAGYQRSGSVGVAYHEADLLPMQSRLRWQQEAGSGGEVLSSSEVMALEPLIARGAAGGIYTPSEAHVEAPRLVAALAQACRSVGVRLVEGTGCVQGLILRESGNELGPVTLTTEHAGTYEADRLLICSGAWSGSFERLLGLPETIHPIRGQICAYDLPDGFVRHMVFSSQAYWVGKAGNSLVCGASEDVAGFDTSVTERGIGRLERWSRRVFPLLKDHSPKLGWAGLRPASRDGKPMLGVLSAHPQVIMAAGHYRNGILLAPVTASAVLELLEGGSPERLIPFSPERFAAPAYGVGGAARGGSGDGMPIGRPG